NFTYVLLPAAAELVEDRSRQEGFVLARSLHCEAINRRVVQRLTLVAKLRTHTETVSEVDIRSTAGAEVVTRLLDRCTLVALARVVFQAQPAASHQHVRYNKAIGQQSKASDCAVVVQVLGEIDAVYGFIIERRKRVLEPNRNRLQKVVGNRCVQGRVVLLSVIRSTVAGIQIGI